MVVDYLKLSKAAFYLAATGLVGTLTYQAFLLPDRVAAYIDARVNPVADRLDQRDAQVKALLDKADRFMLHTTTLTEDTYYDQKASIETTPTVLREIYEVARTIRQDTIPEVTKLLAESKSLVQTLQSDLHVLSGESTELVVNGTDALGKLETLLETLDVQVKAGAPQAQETMKQVDKVLADLDLLLTNQNIQGSLKNVDATTYHLSESAKSVDMALRKLRERAGIVKFILGRVFGILSVPLH